MKILRLPHLPYNIDVTIGRFCSKLLIIPPDCFIQVKNMPKDKLQQKLAPIDLKTIHGCVRKQDVQLVKNFLMEHGAHCVNSLDNEGFTPMHWAALEGDVETFQYLIDNEAELDNGYSNKRGQKPIHWAAIRGRLDLISLIIVNGVDINSQDDRGYTPIISACQYGHLSLVAFLVSKGAKIDIEDRNGDTCLHWAAYKKHPDLTRLLIIYGAFPKKIDNFGQTVLHLACLGGNLNIVQQLVEQDFIDPGIRDKNGKKAVDLASAAGHSETVDLLNRHEKDRRNWKKCNWKTLFFGPVGNTKLIVIFLHAVHWLYEYPLFFFRVGPELWEEHAHLDIAFVIASILMWTFFYLIHFSDPGYIKQDTDEYRQLLKKITFQAQHLQQSDWNKTFSRLCHSCKTVKPLRASHCKICNRCVLAFDHHCPYVQNCVGYKNRPYFFFFVLSFTILEGIVLKAAYILLSKDLFQYILWPGTLLTFVYFFMVGFLLFGALTGAYVNLTTNELVKKKKYDYVQMITKPNGTKTSLFDKGCFYNCKYYFHLAEPSHLEIEDSTYEYYDV